MNSLFRKGVDLRFRISLKIILCFIYGYIDVDYIEIQLFDEFQQESVFVQGAC